METEAKGIRGAILELEAAGFPDGLDVGSDWKQNKFFCLSNKIVFVNLRKTKSSFCSL